MKDPRVVTLARNLVNYSCRISAGEKVYIEAYDMGHELITELIKAVYAAGGLPFVKMYDNRVQRELQLGFTEAAADVMARHELAFFKEMDAYIGV
ncbi:MAG: aminopeptidase, partial [Firmicutes bacterium]|nr:aminopeptidase [Bacillota bacterium]